jgi:hypothetical protein
MRSFSAISRSAQSLPSEFKDLELAVCQQVSNGIIHDLALRGEERDRNGEAVRRSENASARIRRMASKISRVASVL